MLAGDKSVFAIECEVSDVIDNFVYCNFRFWIADKAIGDWSEEVVLSVLMHSAGVFMLYQGDRFLDMANSMNTELLWRHIDTIANSDNPNDLRISLEGRYHQRYLLHEIADDSVTPVCKIIVVERSDCAQRLLWKIKNDHNIQEIVLPKLTVDKAVVDFLNWANKTNGVNPRKSHW